MSLFESLGETASRFTLAFRDYCFINPFDSEQHQRLGSKLNACPIPPDIERIGGPAIADRPELDRALPSIRGVIKHSLSAAESTSMTADECELLKTLCQGELYFRYRPDLEGLVGDPPANGPAVRKLFQRFREDYERVMAFGQRLDMRVGASDRRPAAMDSASHAFAIFFQIRRAFGTIRSFIKGRSRPVNRLRAAMWESVFSADFQLYGDHLYDRMHDINTLILGASGTGKELVAHTIGSCRYLPFTPTKGFDAMPQQAFRPVNLSEFSRDLIESELFGHVAGSFTGATSDRDGVFEGCEHFHTLFLDEIGELEQSIQVKLLRVLQERSFYRVGDRTRRHFGGKIVAATNRDLESEMNDGRFREDLYFRLCADVVQTPTLREQLDDTPDDLPILVKGICEQVLGAADEAIVDQLAERVVEEVASNPRLGVAYAWPGNFRELEQCVRSTLIHGGYHNATRSRASLPEPRSETPTAAERLAADMKTLSLTWDEVLDRYVRLVHQGSKNLTETARRLGKHRSTVLKRLE